MQLIPINKHFNACDQQWDNMPVKDNGRLCLDCNNVLVDMIGKTEQEVLDLQKKHGNKLCGRYTVTQMHRIDKYASLQEQQRAGRPWLVKLAMGVAVSVIPSIAVAQQPIPSQWVDKPIPKDSLVDIYPGYHSPWVRKPLQQHTFKKITGTVWDSVGNESVIFVNVFVKHGDSDVLVGTTTDYDGRFELNIPKAVWEETNGELTLYCQGLGYETYAKTLDSDLMEIDIVLKQKETTSTVIISTGTYIKLTTGEKFVRAINPASWYRRIRYKVLARRASK